MPGTNAPGTNRSLFSAALAVGHRLADRDCAQFDFLPGIGPHDREDYRSFTLLTPLREQLKFYRTPTNAFTYFIGQIIRPHRCGLLFDKYLAPATGCS
jgi:hypothetical protein